MQRNVISFIDGYDPGVFPHDAEDKYGISRETLTNLASNENPYPPPKAVLESIRISLDGVNRYPDPSYRKLKGALSNYTGLPVSKIAVGNGSTEIFDMLCKVFLEPFDRISIISPSYTMYALMGMVREATLEFVETSDSGYRIDPVLLIEPVRKSKMIFLCSPNNPTGAVISDGELDMVLEEASGIVVVDEAYVEFSGTSSINQIPDRENLIVTRSMSKFFSLAGLRIGYCLAPEGIVESLEKIRQPFSISSIGETAAISALHEVAYYEKMRRKILDQREYLLEQLSNIDGLVPYPSAANFILIKVDCPATELVENMASMGVLVRNLDGLSGLDGSHIRITVGTREENDTLLDVMKKALCR